MILDDLHRLDDPAVPAGLDFLLRHAGERLRLVIGARTDPALALHRWRLSGELTEIRGAELAFTADETADLLAAHGTPLAAEQVRELLVRTEGWPAALRFAVLALRDMPDPIRFVNGYTGDHGPLADYLTEEVLAGLSADHREALGRAAVADRISGGLVDTLTGRTDGDQVLADLARDTGFVLATGVRPTVYRCHRMLAELLRAELGRRPADEVRELHRRAAGWCAGHDRPAEALRHALAAGDWDRASGVLVERWPELVPYAQETTAGPPAEAPPVAVVRAAPELALAYALDRLAGADLPAAQDWLRGALGYEELLSGARRTRFARIHAAGELAWAYLAGEQDQVPGHAARLLALAQPDNAATVETEDIPSSPARRSVAAGTGDPAARAVARITLGAAHAAIGELAPAQVELVRGLVDAQRAGLTRVTGEGTGRLALVKAARGELRAADEAARAALELSPYVDRADPGSGGHPYLALALVALHRDRRDEAEANLALANRAAAGCEPAVVALGALVRAHLLRAHGDLPGACQTLRTGRRQLVDRPEARPLAYWLLATEAELRTAGGEPAAAGELLGAPLQRGGPGVEALAVGLARGYLADRDPRAAARVLPDWDAPAAAGWLRPVQLEAGLLDAAAAGLVGDHRRAARVMERVLELADADGYRRVFTHAGPPVRELLAAHLDSGTAYWPTVDGLIRATGPTPGRTAPTLDLPVAGAPVESLTERELTILRYLQSVLSNVEIAAELSLSVNTVKTHVRNIYRKLEASRRREAVRRARELHLI